MTWQSSEPQPPAPSTCSYETVESLDGLEALAGEWDGLVRAMPRPSPFLLHGWLVEWWRHFGKGARLSVAVARRHGRLVGAAPLYISRSRCVRVARFLGANESALADLLIAPGEPESTALGLVGEVRGRPFDYADLFGLPGGSALASAAGTALRQIERVEAPVLLMQDGWDAAYAAKAGSKKHRRRLRQLDELGGVEFVVGRTREELEPLLEKAFRLHQLRWQGRRDGSTFGTEQGQAFHRAALRRLADSGVLGIVLMRVGGRPAAFNYFFALAKTMYFHRLAFDPALAPYSPGREHQAKPHGVPTRQQPRLSARPGTPTAAEVDQPPGNAGSTLPTAVTRPSARPGGYRSAMAFEALGSAATSPVRVLRTPAELEQVAEAWDRLESSLQGPGQHSAWMRAAATSLAGAPPQTVTLSADSLRAAAPLVRRHGCLELATVRQLGEPVDFLWHDEDSLGELCEVLARTRAPLLLQRTPSASPTFRALEAAYGSRAIQVSYPRPGLPFIELDESWLEPESHFNGGCRSDLRRARRRADATGDVTVEFLSPTPEETEHVLSEALAVEARSWKGKAGTALLQDHIRLPFYRAYSMQAAKDGMLRIALFRVSGRAVAMQLGIERARSLWLLKIGYDEAFRRISPGQLLMLETVRHAAGLRLNSLELLGWSEPWTRIWATDERRFARVSFLPRRPRSIIPLAEERLRETARALLRNRR